MGCLLLNDLRPNISTSLHLWPTIHVPFFDLLPYFLFPPAPSPTSDPPYLNVPPNCQHGQSTLQVGPTEAPNCGGRSLASAVSKEILFTNPLSLPFTSYRCVCLPPSPCSFENLHLVWHLTLEFHVYGILMPLLEFPVYFLSHVCIC